jgi:feruloyl esterase
MNARVSPRTVLASAILAALSCGTQAQPFSDAASSPTNYTRATIAPAQACAALAQIELLDVARITATAVAAAGDVPAHCFVEGLIDPEVAFQVALPQAWNGRFYMIGNGGHAGTLPAANARNQPIGLGFVWAATDTGHDAAKEPGASFVLSNPQKAVDYAIRAVHVTAVTAKALANAFYGQPVEYSYWNSCSNGGRQGLLEAQRYPQDFDGIVANAPWVDQTGFTMGAIWNQQALATANVTAGKLATLASSVMEKCDAVDGLEDGLIDDPRWCDYVVAEDAPICAAGTDDDSCLTSAQAEAIQKVYDGPRNSAGEQIFPGFMLGSEQVVTGANGSAASSWMGLIAPATPDAIPADLNLALGTMRYLVPATPQPDWNYSDFDFDRDVEDLDAWSRLADATDPNLGEFRARGGKLLMTYGWADTILQPLMGVNYYQQAVVANGVDGQDFLRLFMIPGMTHCAGGLGPDTHDPVTAVIDWVETGAPPALIVAKKVINGEVARSRPLCPYPEVARYDGSGSIDDAANFRCEAK